MIIKFNLLPKEISEIKKPEERKPIFLKIYFSLLSFILISLIIVAFNTHSKLRALEQDKKNKEETFKKYKTIAIKVRELEKRSSEAKKRIEVIISLKESQGKNLLKLGFLFQSIEPNRLYFNNFNLNATTAQIKGLSYDFDTIADYMSKLEHNRNIVKSLNLKTAQKKIIGNLNLVEFDLEVYF